ncbi:hypothetical protein IW261DRAFT_1334902 [Armillaria novae-zelandiae]|uniref:Uncharacterized protein n=1 Tax=Armillaria novae-zelandiae TaxID=153914 RepID=A0AA39UCA9_9AGAR|nr:hypothetical protein IW261DRAFT_1334902 [Armillaria novae-zelandiae]
MGGYTQFLTKAQGMPVEVTKRFKKVVQQYIWEGKKPKVKKDTMSAPLTEGGKKILDLATRNSAIEILWLRHYLLLGEKRPRWAYLVEDIIHKNLLSMYHDIEPGSLTNLYLQTWETKMQNLPSNLQRMVKMAKKLSVRPETLLPSINVCEQMPMWYHFGWKFDKRQQNNRGVNKCLQQRHNTYTVSDILAIHERTENENIDHHNSQDCNCADCQNDHEIKGCPHPHKCAT